MSERDSLLEAVRRVVRVHSGEDFGADDFPTLEDGRQARAALTKIEEALQAAHDLTNDFVMQRVDRNTYTRFYEVRSVLAEALGRE